MKGFTLLEVLLYIALLSILMSGALETAYQLSIDAEATVEALAPEREGDFVLQKFGSVFANMSRAVLPSGSEAIIAAYGGTQTDISLASGTIMISENGAVQVPLTSSNVAVSNLQFALIPAQGNMPLGIMATATINGIDFTITRYVR